mgnify:CR=1 FL=1
MSASACFGCCSSYTLGLFFILLVSLIWSAASILVQFLYTKESFDSPFLLTYIGVSLFTILLPTKVAMDQVKKCIRRFFYHSKLGSTTTTELLEIPPSAVDDLGHYENVPSVESVSGDHSEEHQEDVTGTLTPYRDDEGGSADQKDDGDNEATNNGEAENSRQSASDDRFDDEDRVPEIRTQPWTNRDHMKAAIKIAPVWFIANWSYNASLAYTSITSSTVLASTGSLFTFLFAVFYKDEKFTCLKFLGVLLGVTGSLFTAMHDASNTQIEEEAYLVDFDNNSTTIQDEGTVPPSIRMRMIRHLLAGPAYRDGFWTQERALFGDALGLISAVGYGGYAVMVRVICPHDESLMSMELLLGYIGLFNMVALSPILFYQLFQGKHAELTLLVFGFLVIKGLLDNVLSDYLWARAVVLTSATVATVGLGLTIPLAFASDVLWTGQDGEQVIAFSSVAGALSVLAGFILVNIGGGDETKDDSYNGDDDEDAATEENTDQPNPVIEIKS